MVWLLFEPGGVSRRAHLEAQVYPVVVVVKDGQGNGFVQLGYVFVWGNVAQFELETPEPAFHETILPGTGSFAATECYLHPLAQFLVLVAQILGSLVGMQDGRCFVFAERIEHGGER